VYCSGNASGGKEEIGFAFAFINDFEKAKEWLISETI